MCSTCTCVCVVGVERSIHGTANMNVRVCTPLLVNNALRNSVFSQQSDCQVHCDSFTVDHVTNQGSVGILHTHDIMNIFTPSL